MKHLHKKNLNELGFVDHILIGVLLIAVIGFGAFGYMYVKDQSKKNAAKEGQITSANQQISELKNSQKIPDGWKKFALGDSVSAILPNDYQQDQALNGTYVFKKSGSSISISVHVNSLPSINSKIFAYDAYCQLNGTTWKSFVNKNGAQTEETSGASINTCNKIVSAKSNGIDYYLFEEIDGFNDHIAYAVKAGSHYYVVNAEDYYNNYGEEAVKAMSIDINKTIKEMVEKIYQANN